MQSRLRCSTGRPPARPTVPHSKQPLRKTRSLCRAVADETTAAELPALFPMDDDEFDQRHAFASYANWLVPGYCMLGRYPFLEPSRVSSREEGERQLHQILSAGVTTFVSLQAETPPQQEMPVRGAAGFAPYKAAADLIAAGMSGPPPGEIVEGLRNPYLDKFVPPRRREAPEAYRNYKPRMPQYVRVPIADLGVPGDAAAFDAAVDDLRRRLCDGERLYMHCWGGRGRSGVVGACLLVRAYGVTADEALERVQRSFALRGDNKDRSPETDEQHSYVHAYAQRAASR